MEVMDVLKVVAVFVSIGAFVCSTYWIAFQLGKDAQKKQQWRDDVDFPEKRIEEIKKRSELRRQTEALIEEHERQRAFEKEMKKRKVR